MAIRLPKNMAEDYFMADPDPFEPDHNYPDNKTNIASSATEITLGEDGALYIYCPRNQLPPARYQNELDSVQKTFKQAFPNTTIIVSGHDLKFTSITKKQEFKAKLDGSIGEEDPSI